MLKFPIRLPLASQSHSTASNTVHKVVHTAALAHTKRTWYRIRTCLSQDAHEWSSEPALCRILPLTSYLPIKSQSIGQSSSHHIHNCQSIWSYFRQSVKLVYKPKQHAALFNKLQSTSLETIWLTTANQFTMNVTQKSFTVRLNQSSRALSRHEKNNEQK